MNQIQKAYWKNFDNINTERNRDKSEDKETMPKISKKKINYCKEGNFFWVKYRDNPTVNYEHIMAYPLFDEVVHDLGKQGYQVIE